MNRREKIIAIAVGLFVGAGLLYLLLNAVLLSPLADRQKRHDGLVKAINDLRTKEVQRGADQRTVQDFARQMLGADAGAVAEAVSRRLTKLVETAGLAQNMKVDIQSPKIVTGGKEVACTVGAEGKLGNVCDLLFLLKASPELHRIDNLSIKPRGQESTVRVDFRYSTLVLDTPKGTKSPTTMPSERLTEVSLNDPNRELYNVVTARNLLARYEPPAPRPSFPPTNYIARNEEPEQPPQPEDWQFKVVALPAWGGAEEIFIRDSSSNSTQKYRVGQPLAGGVIAMVDYRPLPRADRPGLLSPSRLILRLGRDYWAVELGQSLSEKRQMKHNELPPTLQN